MGSLAGLSTVVGGAAVTAGRLGLSDRISLTGLRATGFHGVFDFEKRQGQEFVVDATLFLDTSRAAETDEVTDTVHYGELAEKVAAVVAGEPVDEGLVIDRSVADRLADGL